MHPQVWDFCFFLFVSHRHRHWRWLFSRARSRRIEGEKNVEGMTRTAAGVDCKVDRGREKKSERDAHKRSLGWLMQRAEIFISLPACLGGVGQPTLYIS